MRFQKKQFLLADELEAIVNLHLKTLKDSVLTRFGKGFLRLLYQSIVSSPNNLVLVIKDQNQIIGFLVATKSSRRFYSEVIKQKFLSLFASVCPSFFQDPQLFLATFWWLIKSPPKPQTPAQLQFLAIDKAYQHQGWGTKLIYATDRYFKQAKIKKYIVGTHQTPKSANNFYLKNHFQFLDTQKVLGQSQNFYLKLLK